MTNMNATPNAAATVTTTPRSERTISGPRWTSRSTAPRLISFGWAPVTSPRSRR